MEPDTLGILFGVIATLVAGGVTVAWLMIRHRERMAMIGMGLDPDGPRPASSDSSPGQPVPGQATPGHPLRS